MIPILLGLNFGLFLIGLLTALASIFLILLVLVQRGRGGGLTGALGGMGGQSAFGTKAGDVFTRITVGTAIFWILLCMVTIALFNPPPPPETTAQPAVGGAGDSSEAQGDPNAEVEGAGDFGDLGTGAEKSGGEKSDPAGNPLGPADNSQPEGPTPPPGTGTTGDKSAGEQSKESGGQLPP